MPEYRMRDHRERAEYGYDSIDANVDPLFERTDDFVERMEEIVDARRRSD